MQRIALSLVASALLTFPAWGQQRYEVFPTTNEQYDYGTPDSEGVLEEANSRAIVIDKAPPGRTWYCVTWYLRYGERPADYIKAKARCWLLEFSGGLFNYPGLQNLNQNYQIKGPNIPEIPVRRPTAGSPPWPNIVFWLIDQDSGKLQFCNFTDQLFHHSSNHPDI